MARVAGLDCGTELVDVTDFASTAPNMVIRKDPEGNTTITRIDSRDDDGRIRRTGNMWTASAHVITAVIGSGVLSLAWSIAQLGWIAGPPILFGFAFVTYYTSILLADCYRSPDPVTGRRNYTYMSAVRSQLGPTHVWVCGLVQYVNLIGTAIGYTITASISMVAIKRSNCFHAQGHDAPCHVSNNLYMALFGAFQIVLSMIPDFDRIWWLSIVAAIMSFSYSSIGLGLSAGKTIERHHIDGTATGVSLDVLSHAEKTWFVFQALGNIAFAYSFSMILIEIQDTLKSPPAENKIMKKATLLGVTVTTTFYMSVGCIGYAALGNTAPGNLLTGFGFYNPYWLIDFANVCITVHLVGAYQVFCQPIFAFIENWAAFKFPKSELVHHEVNITVPFTAPLKLSLFKVLWRSLFVVFTTIVAMLLPFFNDIVGLLGAFAFWPLTVYFPVAMHIAQKQVKIWSPKWLALQSLSGICFLISLAAGIGSMAGIVKALKSYAPFKTHY